jgi:hypothetical protein
LEKEKGNYSPRAQSSQLHKLWGTARPSRMAQASALW